MNLSADSVHVAGNFKVGMQPPMTDNMDMVLQLLFGHRSHIPVQIHQRQRLGIDGIPGACAYDGNRQIMVDGAMGDVSSTVCYNSCAACGMTTVRFRVDMSNEEVSPFGVHVAGDFKVGTQLGPN